jgi:rhodanese-related sulfurtransferase
MVKKTTAEALKTQLEKGEALLVDVRDPSENQAECIEQAYLIPLAEICCEKLPTKQRPIVIHCRSGKRSEEACKKLLSEDPSLDVSVLEGGIVAWKAAGGTVTGSGHAPLSMDRQIKIAAGALVIIGVLLGATLFSFFYFLTALVGAGLIYSGITGKCDVEKMLSKLPWNR